MALIPAQPTVDKETLSLRLDRAMHERLKQYAAFIRSPKDYVIGQALRRLFEKDQEFTAWLKAHGTTASAGNGARKGVTIGETRTRLAATPVATALTRPERGE